MSPCLGHLKNQHRINLLLQCCDLLSKIVMIEAFYLFVVSWIYGLHPMMSSFRFLFISLVTLAQLPLVILVIQKVCTIKNNSLRRFIYNFEELNSEILRNEASAIIDGNPSKDNIREHYLEQARKRLERNWSKTKVLPLHPFRNTILGLLTIVLISSLYQQGKTNRMLLALADLGGTSRGQLNISISNQKAHLKNTSFQIQGEVHGEPLFPLEIVILNADKQIIETLDVEQLVWIADERFLFNAVTQGSNEDLWVQARSGSQKSELVRFRMVDFPQIVSTKVTIKPPTYTKNAEETFVGIPFSILKNSILAIEFNFNKKVSLNELEPSTSPFKINSSKASNIITLSAKFHESQSLRFSFIDNDGFKDRSPWHHLKSHDDSKPRVNILKPSTKLNIPQGIFEEFDLSVDTEDDLGLKKLELNYKVRQRFEMNYVSSTGSISLTEVTGTRWIGDITARIPSLYMQAGDTLSYQVVAWDNHPSHGPGYSSTNYVHVPYTFEIYEEAENETQEMVDDLKDIQEDQKDTEALISKIQKDKLKPSRKLTSEKQQQLKELVQKRQEIQKKAEELEQKLDETLRKERENQLLDEGTLMKMEQVRDLYQEIMQDMKAQMMALESMTRDAPKLNNQQMQNMLNKFDKQKFSDELDRTLNTLKKVKAKRKFRKNLKRLEKLRKDHQQIQNLLSENKQVSTTLSNRLNDNFNKIKKELEDLSEDKGLETGLRNQLKKSLDAQGKKISQQYSLMSKSTGEGTSSETAKHNAEIQKNLQKMQKDLNASNREAQQKVMKVDLEQLNLFLRETLMQSIFIKDIDHGIQFLTGLNRKRYAARKFSFLDSSVKHLGSQIKESYEENLNFQKVILKIVELLQQKIDATVDFFAADRPKQRTKPIDQVFQFNNQLTAILINLKDQLEQQRQTMDLSQYLESLEEITEQQQSINQQTQQMHQRIQQQKDMALQQQMMQQLAFQQQLVRKSTEKLYDQFKKKSELAQSLGQVGQKMQEVEKRLEVKKSGTKTQSEQKKIEYKLLEAQQAMKQQQEGKKRKADLAKQKVYRKQIGETRPSGGSKGFTQEILQRHKTSKKYRSIITNYLNNLQ